MINTNDTQHRSLLQKITRRVMLERGLLPDFSTQVLAELDGIKEPVTQTDKSIRDLTNLLWCSLDNDDSRDLDQLTVTESIPGGATKVLVDIADVDSTVRNHSAIDEHALSNTTSVYTVAEIFPMLPEKLSTDITSLSFESKRCALVVEMIIGSDGMLQSSDNYRAIVCNRAKLAYNSVAAWLEGTGPMPEAIGIVNGLEKNIRLQDGTAQKMKAYRYTHGALSFETIEAHPVFDEEEIKDFEVIGKNRANDIIEDFMIAGNGVTVRYLISKKYPSLRRVVRTPKRWDRVVELASE